MWLQSSCLVITVSHCRIIDWNLITLWGHKINVTIHFWSLIWEKIILINYQICTIKKQEIFIYLHMPECILFVLLMLSLNNTVPDSLLPGSIVLYRLVIVPVAPPPPAAPRTESAADLWVQRSSSLEQLMALCIKDINIVHESTATLQKTVLGQESRMPLHNNKQSHSW